MPNNKVTSRSMLQGKKGVGSKSLHEKSRRAKQIVRVGLREEKLKEAKSRRQRASIDRVDRLMHFAHAVDDAATSVSLADLHTLVRAYICRHDEPIREHEKERRPGRPKVKGQERLEQERDAERQEYIEGYLLPDMTDEQTVKDLRYWRDKLRGKAAFIPRIRLVRIFKNDPTAVRVEQAGGGDDASAGPIATAEMDEDED